MAAVELRGLTKRFGALAVVDGVSLDIAHGQLVCLLGPSGCGKTTILRLVAGFLEPSDGEIAVGGRLVSSPRRSLEPQQRNMSMIFQSYALWPHMTVFENVAYGLRLRRLPGETIARRVADMLRTARLEALADRYPGDLSGGQQQRVALARALVVEPETLLLDEPLSNLDANLREEMRFEIRRLHDRYRYTTIYVTHDQAEAMTTADLIVVMNAGRIEQAGPPEEIYYRPRSAFVAQFIGGTNILRGRRLDDRHMAVAGTTLALDGGADPGGGEAGSPAAISIRHHDIKLLAAKPASPENIVPARIARQVFLGSARDYLVEIADGSQMRVVTPADQSIAPGSAVWLHLPPDRCRALAS
ncbi:MAG: ABC transporter ATP-binding protein [Alphaproteobacteria bacterium]|nr:ABC transporter ATP-binding protein [Alphaproteobacteria bacterium]